MARSRNVGVDVLRAAAILIVIALHWVNAHLADADASALDRAFTRVAGHGTYGVALFFILSGFLVTRTSMGRERDLFAMSARDFYVRRIARIQPLFVAVVALGLAMLWFGGENAGRLYGYVYQDPHATYGGEFLLSLFTFTYNWEMILHRNAFMFRGLHWDVMWSLAVEEQFYIAFPLLFLLAQQPRRLYAALGSVVLLGIAVRMLCDIAQAGLLVRVFNSFSCFDTLALGVLLALLSDRLPHRRSLCVGAIALGIVLIATAFYRGGVAWLILGALLFIHGTHHHDVLAPWAKPVAHIGRLSYGLYLLHATTLYLAAPVLAGRNVIVGFLLLVGSACLLAEIAFRAWEVPMNSRFRARFLRRPGLGKPLLAEASR